MPVVRGDGGWRAPPVKARALAALKRKAILLRAEGADAPLLHDLDASWRARSAPRARHARAPKGGRSDLAHDARVDAVTAALAAAPKKFADFKKALPPKPIGEGLLRYVKKQAWER